MAMGEVSPSFNSVSEGDITSASAHRRFSRMLIKILSGESSDSLDQVNPDYSATVVGDGA